MRLALHLGLLLVVVSASGCTNLQQKVAQHTNAGDYAGALAILERAGAGKAPSPKASKQAMSARGIFTTLTTKKFVDQASESESSGYIRRSNEIILDGLRLCPWSTGLVDVEERLKRTIHELDLLESDLRPTFASESVHIDDARGVLRRLGPFSSKMNDTLTLLDYKRRAGAVVSRHLAERVKAEWRDLNQSKIDEICQDLSLVSGDSNTVEAYRRTLSLLCALPRSAGGSKKILTNDQDQSIRELARIFSGVRPRSKDENIDLCWGATLSTFKEFCEMDFAHFLRDSSVPFRMVCLGEQLLEEVPGLRDDSYQSSLAAAHRQRAKLRASQGKAAVIGLLHLQRSQALSRDANDELGYLTQRCRASLATDLPVSMSISIDGDPTIDPVTLRLLQIALLSQLLSDTKDHWKWKWVSPTGDKASVRLYAKAARFISTTWDDLPTVSSKYLSHYEDAPNPMKSILEGQLQTQKFSLGMAKSQYDSAVSFHNMHPTTFSLQNANNAYTRYSMAVDEYNNLVRQYNATPATISRPVYLPYTFREGTIKSGWTASMTISVEQQTLPVEAECIESDFVRYGTKFSDEVVTYRRDDPLTIDVGPDAFIRRLSKVTTQVREALTAPIAHAPISTRADLEDGEGTLLTCALHPFGPTPENVPSEAGFHWAAKLCSTVSLPDVNMPHPEKTTLTRANVPTVERSAREIATLYEPLVCEIQSPFGQGSGVIVSPDGVILTCAHVLLGSDHNAVFHAGKLAGKYKLEILFVNDRKDVAIARAIALRSDAWAPIRLLGEPAKGERIVSVSNPALGDRTTNIGAISQGIISNPSVTLSGGQERVVCDITIAQGSSGGPIVSLETGEIVGIVTHIVEGGIRPAPEVSTSGCVCLAAPTGTLGEWLGLTYSQINADK